MEAQLKAEVTSALALLEDLSTKSSDSRLSEETCWELFGGPCPEALRKKVGQLGESTLTEEESEKEKFFSALEIASEKERSLDKAGTEKKESIRSPPAEQELSEKSLAPQRSKLPSQVEKVTPEKSSEKLASDTKTSEAKASKRSSLAPETTENPSADMKDELISLKREEATEQKLSSENALVSEELDGKGPAAAAGSNGTKRSSKKTSPTEAVAEEAKSIRSEAKSPTKTSKEEKISDEKVKSISSKKESISKSSQTHKSSEARGSKEIEKEAIKKTHSPETLVRVEDYDVSPLEKSEDSQNSKIYSTIGLQKGRSVSAETETSKLASKLASPITPLPLDKHQQTATAKVSNFSTNTSVSSVAKSPKHISSESSKYESSKSDTTVSSEQSIRPPKQPKTHGREAKKPCSCCCCIARKIQQTRGGKDAGHCGGCLQSKSVPCKCCKKCSDRVNKNYKINIFADDSSQEDCCKKCIKITGFNEDSLDKNSKPCNKRMQTSMLDMYESPGLSKYLPPVVNPLYINPAYIPTGYSTPRSNICPERNYKTITPSRPKPRGCKCSGDYGKQPESSESDSQSSENYCECTSGKSPEKLAPRLAESLKNALQRRNTVKKVVDRFEKRKACCGQSCGDHGEPRRYPANNRQQKSRIPASYLPRQPANVCQCCNKPKSDTRKYAQPVLPNCKCKNWRQY